MIRAIIFVLGSIGITWISIPSLRNPRSHGFYRYFVWEIILGMFVYSLRDWFVKPLAWFQIISWILLIGSLFPLFQGIVLLRTIGKPTDGLEATTHLVTKGIYRFIRHPLYASLLSLAWGIFFKSPSILNSCLVTVSTVFIYITARIDEFECLAKFGEEYAEYMERTKMFIPRIL